MKEDTNKEKCCAKCSVHRPYKTWSDCSNKNCPCHTPTVEDVVKDFYMRFCHTDKMMFTSAIEETVVFSEREAQPALDYLRTTLTKRDEQIGTEKYAEGYKQGRFDAEMDADYPTPHTD